MNTSITSIVTTLIAAFIGSLGAVLLKDYLEQKAKKQSAHERILQLYLLQLQDAIESLWYRLNNMTHRGEGQ